MQSIYTKTFENVSISIFGGHDGWSNDGGMIFFMIHSIIKWLYLLNINLNINLGPGNSSTALIYYSTWVCPSTSTSSVGDDTQQQHKHNHDGVLPWPVRVHGDGVDGGGHQRKHARVFACKPGRTNKSLLYHWNVLTPTRPITSVRPSVCNVTLLSLLSFNPR